MRCGSRTACLLVLLLVARSGVTAGRAHGKGDCTVQVSSVTADRKSIHAAQEPNSAVVTVQVAVVCAGDIPVGAKATVKLLTYSAEPVGNNVDYDDEQTLPLEKSPAVFRLKVRGGPSTVTGYVTIYAEIKAATAGVTVKDPEGSSALARLETVAP